MQRYSSKRQAILDCLRSTKTHPTAEWVYGQLKGDFPSLSLATVYRNLAQCKQAGLIRSVGIVQGLERFDGNAAPHFHIVCTQCGAVTDAEALRLPDDFVSELEARTGCTVSAENVQLSGLCPRCTAEKNTNN